MQGALARACQCHASTMIDNLIAHNREIIPLGQAHLSPGQAGLLLGWGVFTTLRLYRGAPFEFERHWERMARDAARLRMGLGVESSDVLSLIADLARRNQREEGMARVSFVRNTGGSWAYPGERPPVDLLIFTQSPPSWPESYRLQIQPGAVFSAGVLAGAKMLSWASNSSIMERVRAEGFDDGLLLNEHGQLTECTSANLFLVEGGVASTPPLTSGCLPGVTREILLSVGPRAGIPVVEKELTTASLDRAEEVFISSTTREVGGVHEIDQRWKYSSPGKVTRAAAAVFKQYVEESLKSTGKP
ncbi:MAG: aminotransferase class IV [Terriglobia bacterium]